MDTFWDVLRSAWKAIAAFLAVFLAQLVANVSTTSGEVVLPSNGGDWATALGAAFVGALLVYLLPNRYTKPQVKAQVDRLPEEEQKDIMRAKDEEHPNWK